MRHEQTIAIIRDLVENGRIGTLRDIVHPLLADTKATTLSIDEQALIRVLLARGEVVCSRQSAAALAMLVAFTTDAKRPDLSHGTRGEIALSLGLARSIASESTFDPGLALAALEEAEASLRNSPIDNAWIRLGRARVFFGIGQKGLASEQLGRARHVVAILSSPTLSKWYEELRLMEGTAPMTGNGADTRPGPLVIAESRVMRSLMSLIDHIEHPRYPIFLSGEVGTGKRLLAQVILDRLAPKADRLTVSVDTDVAQLKEHLARWKQGIASLFIDNIDRLDRAAQSLLAAGVTACKAEPRFPPVVATSTKDRHDLLGDRHCDPNLARSFGVLQLRVPPLRDRREDIVLLARRFVLDRCSDEVGAVIFSSAARDALMHYDWPGNVTELRVEIDRLVDRMESEPIPVVRRQDLGEKITGASHRTAPLSVEAIEELLRPGHDLDEVLASTEKAFIERVLVTTQGQITAASEMLGLTRQGLYKKIKRLGIDPQRLLDSTPVEADGVTQA